MTTAVRPKFFRWAAGLSMGLLIVGIVLAVALVATYRERDAGLPILFFGMVYVVIALPVCLASAVLAGLSLKKGEGRSNGALAILIVMGAILWIFRWAPFRFTQALIEGYLQRPWP